MMRKVLLAGAAVAVTSAMLGCSIFPGTSCFVRGTRVRTPSGTKAIEELAIDDEVIAFVEATMELVVRRVTALHFAHVERVRTILVANRRIVTTDEHPFWEAERRIWMRAGDLRAGSVLAVLEDGRLVPATIEAVIDEQRRADVFNLTVEGPEHTYLAEDVAVHNKSVACRHDDDDCAPLPSPPPSPEPAPGTSESPRPGVSNDIALVNGTGQVLDVRVLSKADGAVIDSEMALGRSAFAIPELHFARSIGTSVALSPGELRVLEAGAITVVDAVRGASETRHVVVVDVEGTRAMLVGTGLVDVQRNGGRVELKSEWNAVQILPLDRNVGLTCEGPRTKLTLPTVAPAQVGKRFIMGPPAIEGGCMSIVATPEDAAAQPLDVEVCGPTALWPFAANDVVVLERPTLIEDTNDGVRFVRASDAKAVELAHVRQRGRLFMQPEQRVLALDTNACAVPDSESCTTLTIRAKLVDHATRAALLPATPLAMRTKAGNLFVLGAVRSLYALSCGEDFGVTFDVVALSGD